MYYVYMLRCLDNSIYTGITTDLDRRIKEHKEKQEKGAKYTKRHTVSFLETAWKTENRVLASKLEYHIKRLKKQEKEELIKTKNLKSFFNDKLEINKYKNINDFDTEKSNNKKKEIVIFGGSFNPPLNSHFSLAEQIINEYDNIEKVIFVPVNSKYSKPDLLSNKHRYNMLKLVCDKNEKFDVSDVEIKSDRALYTIETLKILQKKYKNYNLLFTLGTDNLKELYTWHNVQELVDNFKILVLERDEDKMENIIKSDNFLLKNKKSLIKVKNNVRSNLSSTFVRNKIRNGKSIRYLTPDEVYNYIKENKLFEK